MSRPPPRRPHRNGPPSKGKNPPGRHGDKRPSGDRPSGERIAGERPSGQRKAQQGGPKQGKFSPGRPTGQRPPSERTFGERASGERSGGRQGGGSAPSEARSGRPGGKRPFKERPSGERSYDERPSRERPAGRHDAPTPDARPSRPAAKRPSGDRPFSERPAHRERPAHQERPVYQDRPTPERSAPERSAAPPRAPVVAKEGGGQWLYGQHPVEAALADPRRAVRRLLATEEAIANLPDTELRHPELVDRRTLDQMLPGAVHQGLALLADPLPEPDFDQLIAATENDSLYLVLDQVTDPHNVGAILRSAAAFGAAAVIVQERHSPPVSGTLAKAASGAVELVPLCRVVNLARALRDLKDAGVRTVGLDSEADEELGAALAPGPLALVLGAEGEGLRRLVAETCDALARLPTRAPLASLNVSNAAAIALYAARMTVGK